MAKVLLISGNVTKEPYPVYPLGMSLVAAAARRRGHEVRELDLIPLKESYKNLQEEIEKFAPQFIGVSIRNVDNVNYNEPVSYIPQYAELVKQIKDTSSAPLIIGGSAFTIFPEEILATTGADYGIVGEGESQFCNLIEQLEQGWPPAEKILSGNGSMSGENFHSMERDAGLADYYLKKGGMLNVQTKRGCPHRCAYCSYPLLEGRRYRFRPARDVADEIEMLIKKYQADYYAITDSVFNDAAGKYLEIAEELVRRDINTPWMCYLRPDDFSDDAVDLLKRAGLTSVEWGTDCSTDVTLKAMQKDFFWEAVIKANDQFAAAGIANGHFIIFGGPGETGDTFEQGLRNVMALENCVVFAGTGVRIFPDTTVHRITIEEGLISAEQDISQPTWYFSPDINQTYMHRRLTETFAGRKDRIYQDHDFVEMSHAFHLFGYRGPVWDYILKKGKTRRKR